MTTPIPLNPLLDLPILDALSHTFKSLLLEAARSSPDDRSERIQAVKEWHHTTLSLLATCRKIRSVMLPVVWEKFELKQDEVAEWKKLVRWDSIACMKLITLPGQALYQPSAAITHNVIFRHVPRLQGLDVSQWDSHPQPHTSFLPSLKMVKVKSEYRMALYIRFEDEKTKPVPAGPSFLSEPATLKGSIQDLRAVHIIFKADEAAIWADEVEEEEVENDDEEDQEFDEEGEPIDQIVTRQVVRTSGFDMTEWMSQERFQEIQETKVLCCHLEFNTRMRDDFALVMGVMDSDIEYMDRMPDDWFDLLDRLSYYPKLEVFHLHLIYTSTDAAQETYTDEFAYTHYDKHSSHLDSLHLQELATSAAHELPLFRRLIVSIDHVQTTIGGGAQATPKQRQANRYYKNQRRAIGKWEMRFDREVIEIAGVKKDARVYGRMVGDRLPRKVEDWMEGYRGGSDLTDDVDVGTTPFGQEDMIRDT